MNLGIIGPNTSECTTEIYDFGIELGQLIAKTKHILICGGMGGFMEAVCKGVKESPFSFFGQTVGILPSEEKNSANPYIDIPIATGIGIARNIIIVNSSDLLIACGGGSGTLSEIAFAWQKKKKVLCVTHFGGWSAELAGRDLDTRNKNLLISVRNLEDIEKQINLWIQSPSIS